MSCCFGRRSAMCRRCGRGGEPDPSMKLIQVHALFRHGARTSLYPPSTGDEFSRTLYRRSLVGEMPESSFPYEVLNFWTHRPFKGVNRPPLPFMVILGVAYLGELTTLGQAQMIDLGKYLLKTYAEPLGLRRDALDQSEIMVRSTNCNRTIRSLCCVLVGMYGTRALGKPEKVKIYIKPLPTEDLHPSDVVNRQLGLQYKRIWFLLNTTDVLAKDLKKIEEAFDMQSASAFDILTFHDEIKCRQAQEIALPRGYAAVVKIIEKDAAKILYSLFTGTCSFLRRSSRGPDSTWMSVGRLLTSILSTMEDSGEDAREGGEAEVDQAGYPDHDSVNSGGASPNLHTHTDHSANLPNHAEYAKLSAQCSRKVSNSNRGSKNNNQSSNEYDEYYSDDPNQAFNHCYLNRDKKLYLYATHDVTIGPLLHALGLWKDKWPAFADCILLELYRGASGELFVRGRYNTEVVPLIGGHKKIIPLAELKRGLQMFTKRKGYK